MARSGPQYYPGASRAYWYEDNYGGSTMEVNVCVLHTTEGTSLPSYGGGASAPNITALPDFGAKKLRWYQHFRIDTSSRALVNLRGGPETNTLNVVQVELVGTCDPSTHRRWGGRQHIYWPEAPDWALRDLGEFIGWLHREHRVRLQAPSRWLPYPQSYGTTSARMSASDWRGFYGVCGHQHVVENDHGDPGNLPIERVLAYARGEEDDMAMSDAEFYEKAWRRDGVMKSPWGTDDNPTWMPESLLERTAQGVHDLEKAVPKLAGQIGALAAIVGRLAEGGGITAAELQAAAEAGGEAGARAALAELGDTLTKEY